MANYGYLRVSTGRQAEDGASLETQTRQIQGYAQMQGIDIDQIFIERGVSGALPLSERPEGGRLSALLKDGDTIISAKLDRMFRSASDALLVCERLKERNIALHFIDLGGDVTGDGISKLVFTILSAVAEAERDRIRERVRESKAQSKAEGKYCGGRVPFGYVVGGDNKLIRDEQKAKLLEIMRARRNDGASYRTLEAEFNVPRTTIHKLLSAGQP